MPTISTSYYREGLYCKNIPYENSMETFLAAFSLLIVLFSILRINDTRLDYRTEV